MYRDSYDSPASGESHWSFGSQEPTRVSDLGEQECFLIQKGTRKLGGDSSHLKYETTPMGH